MDDRQTLDGTEQTLSATPSSRELALLLSTRLQAAVPDGVVVTADGADVVVRVDGTESRNGTAAILDDDGRTVDEAIRTAARAILSHVQDVVAEATTEPWPATGGEMPLPGAEVRGGRLRAWFGDRDAPVLVVVEDG